MTPDNNIGSNPPSGKDENQSSSIGRKTSNLRPQEPAIKCPRCDSPNTKFCYYNNYSLTQPRHFCKTCRRYWTKGGALRNVPIGGGCRKNKKMKACTRISGDSKDSSGSSDIGGLKFFQGISPAMDFQLGGINFSSPSTCLFNQFSSFGDLSNTCNAISSSPCFNLDPVINPSPLMGLSFPFSSTLKQVDVSVTSGFQEMGSLNVHSSIASSIESLSSINQDLHWKFQQQRLANMLYIGDLNHKENSSTSLASPTIGQSLVQKPQPILFQNLDTSKTESCGIGTSRKDGTENGNLSTEWFFDNSYATVTPTPATSSSPNNANANANNTNNWSGMQAWSDLTQYTVLP